MTIDIEHMGVHILNESDVCAMIEQNAALAAALESRGHSEFCLPGRCHCGKRGVSEILAAHDAAVRQKVLLDEWEHDWPAIFHAIADEADERLAPDAQVTKRRILEAVENSAWLQGRDAATRRPLLEALRKILSYWSAECGDSEYMDKYAPDIDEMRILLSRYTEDGREK